MSAGLDEAAEHGTDNAPEWPESNRRDRVLEQQTESSEVAEDRSGRGPERPKTGVAEDQSGRRPELERSTTSAAEDQRGLECTIAVERWAGAAGDSRRSNRVLSAGTAKH